ncbi:MAG: hypothetical protein KJO62_09045 [Gammaproteobacteria bacterium]|nr:hypothetical protein [Gammaproteobacteria bacterium]
MTRKRSDRLAVVVRLAQLKEQRERVNFSAAREAHAQQRKLCTQLEQYLDEYQLLNAAGQTTVATLSALRNGSHFVAQLSASLEQQQQQAALSSERMQ